jgi:MazG family protein
MRKEFEYIQDLSGSAKLQAVIEALRHPSLGCPWDLEQNALSLLKYLSEEAAEFIEAVQTQGPSSAAAREELGDVLYQVVLHAELLREARLGSLDEIAEQCAEKVIARHPHVFDPDFERFETSDEVSQNWEKIKARARSNSTPTRTPTQGALDVPASLPSSTRAARVGEKAASLGFDWSGAEQVLPKVEEELEELREAWTVEHRAQEEFGDLMFALAQLARKRGWDPEHLTHQATVKFQARFEQTLKRVGRAAFEAMTLEQKEMEWSATKRLTP